jgi:hypothetical protein
MRGVCFVLIAAGVLGGVWQFQLHRGTHEAKLGPLEPSEKGRETATSSWAIVIAVPFCLSLEGRASCGSLGHGPAEPRG